MDPSDGIMIRVFQYGSGEVATQTSQTSQTFQLITLTHGTGHLDMQLGNSGMVVIETLGNRKKKLVAIGCARRV